MFFHMICFFQFFLSFLFDYSVWFPLLNSSPCMLINVHSQTACWALSVFLSHFLSLSLLRITPPFFSIRALIRRVCLIRHSVIADYCVFPRAPLIASNSFNTAPHCCNDNLHSISVCSFLSPCCIIFLFIILPSTSLPVKWIPHSGTEVQIFLHPLLLATT